MSPSDRWLVAAIAAVWCGCYGGAGYSQRGDSSGVVAHAAFDVLLGGADIAGGAHRHEGDTIYTVRGSMFGSLGGAGDLDGPIGVLLRVHFFGLDYSWNGEGGDTTIPVGPGGVLLIPTGDETLLALAARYQYHFASSSEPRRKHELVLSVGFGISPEQFWAE